MKSFLALERSATFTCRKKGVERKYLVYEGQEFVNFDLIHEKSTSEEDGVKAELVINGWQEKNQFADKAKSKLAYYDTAVLIIDEQVIDNQIYRNKLFQWSTLNRNTNVHLTLKDVYYTIDYDALGIPAINIPIAIRLGLGDGLTPTPSRESYITNEKVRSLLTKKIQEIADWFAERYNNTVKEFPTFMDAFAYLGNNDHVVRLDNQDFHINPILKYTQTKILAPKIKGLKIRDGLWYKVKTNYMLQEYSDCGYLDYNGKMKTKENWMTKENVLFSHNRPLILVGDNFVGNIRTYLKSKYVKETNFIRKNSFVRKLGSKEDNKKHVGLDTPDTFYNILDLHFIGKGRWREHVNEWNFVVSTITSKFVDETDVANSKEYQDWLAKKIADQKAKRALGITSGNYNGLNKQLGDITMAYSYERYGRIHFKKAAYPIANLPLRKELTVILTEDEAEEAKMYIKVSKCKNITFAVVGKLERKKIPNHYQFITFKQYISMDCKPFMRLASAIMFSRVVEDYQKLSNHKNGLFKMCVSTLDNDVAVLKKYQDENYLDCGEIATESAILQVAESKNLFDMQYWDVYQRVRAGLKKFDFINLLQEPSYYDTEHQKRYQTIINQMLLFRKKFYNDLEGAEIVFNTPKAKV